ncbi:hypothetical protein OFC13_30535, partial [Escherichia coli]|nr:hypothetical protein [Escherichia coli]
MRVNGPWGGGPGRAEEKKKKKKKKKKKAAKTGIATWRAELGAGGPFSINRIQFPGSWILEMWKGRVFFLLDTR